MLHVGRALRGFGFFPKAHSGLHSSPPQSPPARWTGRKTAAMRMRRRERSPPPTTGILSQLDPGILNGIFRGLGYHLFQALQAAYDLDYPVCFVSIVSGKLVGTSPHDKNVAGFSASLFMLCFSSRLKFSSGELDGRAFFVHRCILFQYRHIS